MNIRQVEEFLRSRGVSEDEITAERARLDQGAAAVDDLTLAAINATRAETPEEAVVHGLDVITIYRAHLGEISPTGMDFAQQVAARLAHAVMTIWSLSDKIAALEAENARLRRGR